MKIYNTTDKLEHKEKILKILMESYEWKLRDRWNPKEESNIDSMELKRFGSKDNGETLIIYFLEKPPMDISLNMNNLLKNTFLNIKTTEVIIKAIRYFHRKKVLFMSKNPEDLFNQKKLKKMARKECDKNG